MTQLIDARPSVEQLRQELNKKSSVPQEFVSLTAFLSQTDSQPDRWHESEPQDANRKYLDGIVRALSGLYVHMPFKRARHGASPIERLRALALNLPNLRDLDFQEALLGIFLELHDPHTFYVMPKPYKASTAFLPFLVAACYDRQTSVDVTSDPDPQFVVMQVAGGFKCPGLEPGARITHWNGVPIALAVHRMAVQENGANRYASFARAIDHLTIRPLGELFPPDEATMTIGFQPARSSSNGTFGMPSEATIDWSVRVAGDDKPADLRKLLFDRIESNDHGWKQWVVDVPFQYKIEPFPHPTSAEEVNVGIVRIHSFRADPNIFTVQFSKLLAILAKEAPLALIIDVRGNRGGDIQCGEKILQLLTPRRITPVSFQFLNTPLLRQIAKEPGLRDLSGFGLTEDTGAIYSRSDQITSTDEANSFGQRYYGRVALITDALCYSTTDIFAAGFQDHRVGPVIGLDRSTGAGGANTWTYKSDLEGKPDQDGRMFPELPGNADIQISVRQCMRTGRFRGQILEDFGVAPDYMYFISKEDLFDGGQGLYEFALAKLLYAGGLKEISVDMTVTPFLPEGENRQGIEIHCQTSGVSRCEVAINKTVSHVFDAHPDGCRWQGLAQIDASTEGFSEIELRCYDLLPRRDVPFYTETEAATLQEGEKKIYQLVASRKVFQRHFDFAESPISLFAKASNGESRKRILYFVRGYGRVGAVEGLAVINELTKLVPDVDVRFVSYGTGARTLREAGKAVLDLGLPDRPDLFEVQEKFTQMADKWEEFGPQLIVAHEEYEIARLAGPSVPGNTKRGAELPCPCVLVTSDLNRTRWHHRRSLIESLLETIVSRPAIGAIDQALRDCRISRTGPILRPLSYWREQMSGSSIAGYAQVARQKARKEAREAKGLPDDEFIASVFVDPGGRTELAAPLYDRLKQAFDKLDETKLVRKVLPDDWSTGSKTSNFEDRPFKGKRLLWDLAARTREGLTFDTADYGRFMAASDLAITKCDCAIDFELAYMGVPTISVSHSGLDSRKPLHGNHVVPYAELQMQTIQNRMVAVDPEQSFSSKYETNPFGLGGAPDDGLKHTAMRLNELLDAIVENPDPEILRMVRQLTDKDLDVAVFRKWFGKYRTRLGGPSDLVVAVSSVLDQIQPLSYMGVLREAEGDVSRALEDAIQRLGPLDPLQPKGGSPQSSDA